MDIEILLAIQTLRNSAGVFLAEFFSGITFFGELNTTLVIMAVVYWVLNKKLGTYLLMGWSGNRLVNGMLKVTACAYRPWIRDNRIIPYGDSVKTATGYSFPSGHCTNAATVYGGAALRKETPKALRILLLFLVALVMFSRLYLGVHTPQDVLVGAGASLIVMWLTLSLMRWVEANPGKDLFVAAAGVLIAIALALFAALKSYPADYNAQGELIVDGAKMANDTFKGVGWSSAFLVGWVLERRYANFSTFVSVPRKLIRTAAGLGVYALVALVLVPLIKGWIPGPAGTIASCFFQMFVITFLFPWGIALAGKVIEKQSSGKA